MESCYAGSSLIWKWWDVGDLGVWLSSCWPKESYSKRGIWQKNLNDTATTCIRRGMTDKQRRPYIHITSAKELWDNILRTKTGTSTLWLAQYEIAKGQLQNFWMEKGESPKKLLERLMTLTTDIESSECDKTQDGFNLTKRFLVDKLLHALAPYHHITIKRYGT